jgi:hypothetical protein
MGKPSTATNYTGINIQWPISQLILSGEKTIETRTYPIPKKYIGKKMLLIETPGKTGTFKSRIAGIIKFEDSFCYQSKEEFLRDVNRHFVGEDSDWAWTNKKKWGWPVTLIRRFAKPIPLKKRIGIRFTKDIFI